MAGVDVHALVVALVVFDAAAARAAASEQGTASRLRGQWRAAGMVALEARRCVGAIRLREGGLLRAARTARGRPG